MIKREMLVSSEYRSQLRVAFVHDWLLGMRGGEKMLAAVLELFPSGDIFTLFFDETKVSKAIADRVYGVSVLNRIPGAKRFYRHLLPLFPWAIRRFQLHNYDLVISFSHCVAKAVPVKGVPHISYIFAPMRYMWGRFDEYFGKGRSSTLVRFFGLVLRPFFQLWDKNSNRNITKMITQSRYIQNEIRDSYGITANIVPPFFEPSRFNFEERNRLIKHRMIYGNEDDFYLMVGAFAPYKRVDLAILAANQLKKNLIIVGTGQDERRLHALAGPTVRFLGAASDEVVNDLYLRCRAFLFTGEEDFGITPLEANAAGVPVIAYRAGGVLDTLDDTNAVFFDHLAVDALVDAILRFEIIEYRFEPIGIAERVRERFTKSSFQNGFLKEIESACL